MTAPARALPAALRRVQERGLPIGFSVELDHLTRRLDERHLFGGSPARVLTLSAAGVAAFAEVAAGPIASERASRLARRLVDSGLAHPRPPEKGIDVDPAQVTVVIPVRDRPAELARCLQRLGHKYRVVVVDDGSLDAAAVARVVAAYGARLVTRPVNGGPGAARNTGIAATSSDVIAFLDSDCEPDGDWIACLLPHFADPLVGAVAPRIVTSSTGGGRWASSIGGLDLGDRESPVFPGASVSYVPTAALLVRRRALAAPGGPAFEESLRVGEDVDLIWRLHERGWRIRYVPQVQVVHRDPTDAITLLHRRYRYGTSAGPLARRHPETLAPLVLHPWPTAVTAAVLTRRPLLASMALAGSIVTLRRRLNRADIPPEQSGRAMINASRQTLLGLGRYLTQFWSPVLLLVAGWPGRRFRWRRLCVLALVLLPPLERRWPARRATAGGRATLGSTFDYVAGAVGGDVCYGAGVWRGALSARTVEPVLPRCRPLRVISPRRPV